MTPISYTRAAASFLPFVGPIIAEFNLHETEKERTIISSIPSRFNFSLFLHSSYEAFFQNTQPALLDGETTAAAKTRIQTHKEKAASFSNQYLPLCAKGHVCAFFGLIGHLLTIASLIRLLALCAFSNLGPLACVLPFVGVCFIGCSSENLLLITTIIGMVALYTFSNLGLFACGCIFLANLYVVGCPSMIERAMNDLSSYEEDCIILRKIHLLSEMPILSSSRLANNAKTRKISSSFTET